MTVDKILNFYDSDADNGYKVRIQTPGFLNFFRVLKAFSVHMCQIPKKVLNG